MERLLNFFKQTPRIFSCSEEDSHILKLFNNWCIKQFNVEVCCFYRDKNVSCRNVSNYYIIKYLLINFDNNYSRLKKVLCEYHLIDNNYVFNLLLSNDIYKCPDEDLKYFCTDVLVECMTKNSNCIYPANYRYMLRHNHFHKYTIYVDSVAISLIITHFLKDWLELTSFDIDDINELSKYTNSWLHRNTFEQIRNLIFKLLNEKRYIDNMVNLYKVLMSFNVLNREEIQSIKDKEAKLIMKGLF